MDAVAGLRQALRAGMGGARSGRWIGGEIGGRSSGVAAWGRIECRDHAQGSRLFPVMVPTVEARASALWFSCSMAIAGERPSIEFHFRALIVQELPKR